MLASSSNALRLRATQPLKRALHDMAVLSPTKPIVSSGPPGYSAAGGHIVTVFGCTGFLGRYVVSKIAKTGSQVVVPYRDEDSKRHLKVMGDLGQVVPMEFDLRDDQQIVECLRHSDIVYNLIGRNYTTKNFSYDAVHVNGAERLAKLAARAGVQRFVHVSHLNAAHDSQSEFYRSKAAGEEAVKASFPNATIVRPGSMYGYEDRLLRNMAAWPIWWKLNHGETTMRPVHVLDVAQALTNLLRVPALAGTINLPGPSEFTHEWLLDLVSTVTYLPPSTAPVVPKAIVKFGAKLAQNIWWPALCPDEVERRYMNDTDVDGDWDVVGVTPGEIEHHAITYLRQYRAPDDYTRPTLFPPRAAIQQE